MTTGTDSLQLAPCHRLRAHISKKQCEHNRSVPMFACVGCKGLPEPIAVASALSVAEVLPPPTVVLRFTEPEDVELFRALQKVCSNLEHDILSLLHLSCRGDVSRAISAKARA